MSDLTQLLVAASRADRSAEARLQESANTNYAELVQALALEIATEGNPLEASQMAALFFKNTLNAPSHAPQRDAHERWKLLDPAVRNNVKEALLKGLRSNEPSVPKFAAIAASEVACVELPFLEWPTFVTTMTSIMTDQNINANTGTPNSESAKLACLECLGFTCQRVEEVQALLDNVPDLAEQTMNAMLTTIVQGVQPTNSDAMRFMALTALSKSLQFCHKNMEVTAERDVIMKNAIFGAATSTDARARQLAFQCLDVVASLYYEKLREYMTQIFEHTVKAIKTDTDDVKMAALEFWCQVAQVEEAALQENDEGLMCQKYVESAMGVLVPILFETLATVSEDADADEWDVRASGATCLDSFSVTVGNAIVPLIMPFVQTNIVSANWRMRDAAIVAFSCCLDGPTTDVVGPYVQQSIPVLMGAFSDPNEVVRDDAIHCVDKIATFHMAAVQPDHVHGILQGLMIKLDEAPTLATHACSAIFNISASLKSHGDRPSTNLLSAPMLPLMQKLLSCMDHADAIGGNLRVGAMASASELITASAVDVQPILKDLLPVIIDRIESALKMEVLSNDNREIKAQNLGLLTGLVTPLYQRLDRADVLPVTDRVMSALVMVLQVPNATCQEEAFLCIGAVATSLEDEFTKYLTGLMQYLIVGLRNYQAHQLCMVCVGTVVDICSAVGGQIQPFCDQIVGALTDCLKDGSAHRDTKPVVFSCFGDVALAIGASFEPYLQVAAMLLMQASQAKMQLDDDDLVDFINRLRLSVLEAYTGIIAGLSDGSALHLIVPYVPNITQFIQFLSTPESYKDDLCLQRAVALVGDIANDMGSDERIRQQISQPFVAHLLQEASTSHDSETRELALWTHGVLQGLARA